jgi:arylsulfatase A-like enzyme
MSQAHRVFSLAVFLALSLLVRMEAATAQKPNILFILTDDQRWNALGCYGNPIIHTPQMDALAKEGIRFRNAFVTTAICAASRASLLTGLYERTHRYTFGTPPIQDAHTDISYPVQLRQAGYRTGFIGKFGVDVSPGRTTKDMFDYYEPLNRNPYFKKQPDGSEKHLTDIAFDKAVAFLDTVDKSKPWCLSLNFNEPHAEDNDKRQYIWPKTEDALYQNVTIPEVKTMAAEYFESNPDFLKNSESRLRYDWRFNETGKYQEMVKGYYRMISGVDRVIGQVRTELAKRGLAENTIIIFTSDNGYFLGERGFADKWYLYEHSVRVPMIIVDPKLPAIRRGETVDLMALNVDLAPTILSYAGIKIPSLMQGRSLIPLVNGKAPADWRTDFFYEHLFDRANIPKSEGVRTERWSYIRWFEQQPLVEELYDHQADFEEVNNLVKDPAYASVLEQLRKRTDQLRDGYGGVFKPWPKPEPKGKKSKVKAKAE